MMREAKEFQFLELVERVQACRKCERMSGSARVLGLGCGPLDARVVFVGEAPGRLGADDSHLPFHGDKAGHNFESLIEQVGISRYDVFVSNAVLCNPKDAAGNNATPTTEEIRNCAGFLREQLEIVAPELVVTLGAVALKACALVEPHDLTLRGNVRTVQAWFGRRLIPAYHPGQRAMIHRSFAYQLADYQFIAETIERSSRGKRSRSNRLRPGSAPKLAAIARRIVQGKPNGVSYFALHKLYFLAEVAQLEAAGERLSNSFVVRQKDGPYCVELHLGKLAKLVPELIVSKRANSLMLHLAPVSLFQPPESPAELSAEEIAVIDRTVARYKEFSDGELKRVSYLSRPMRQLLRKEKALRLNLFNAAVLPYVGR